MWRNWFIFGLTIISTSCKTGEIDDVDPLKEEINLTVSHHLYPGTNVKAFAFAEANHWFFASGSEITQVKNNQKTVFSAPSAVISMDWNIKEETLWFGTDSSGLGQLKDGALNYYTRESHGLPRTNYIRDVTCDDDGGTWFNTSAHKMGGLGYHKNGIFSFFTPDNSILPDNLVKSIARNGNNLFVATGGYVNQQKVVKISNGSWTLLPVTGYYLMDMAVDKDNKVYIIDDYSLSSVVTQSKIILLKEESTQTISPEIPPGSWYHPYVLAVDRRNYLWAAQFAISSAKILQVFNGIKWLEPQTFPDSFINCISVDSKNTVWIGTNNGIYLLDQ